MLYFDDQGQYFHGPLLQLMFFPNVLLSVFSMALGALMIMFTLETPDYQKLIKTMGELEICETICR